MDYRREVLKAVPRVIIRKHVAYGLVVLAVILWVGGLLDYYIHAEVDKYKFIGLYVPAIYLCVGMASVVMPKETETPK